MTDNHPITPPPELVQQWWEEADQYQDDPKTYFDHVATEAARWGADQELEACIEVILSSPVLEHPELTAEVLRAWRRPKPPSLKERALQILDVTQKGWGLAEVDLDTIRRALEALPE